MPEDLLPLLTRFHREIVVPDIERIVGNAVDGLEQRMNAKFDEVYGHFDAIYQRFDRLEGPPRTVVTPARYFPSPILFPLPVGRR